MVFKEKNVVATYGWGGWIFIYIYIVRGQNTLYNCTKVMAGRQCGRSVFDFSSNQNHEKLKSNYFLRRRKDVILLNQSTATPKANDQSNSIPIRGWAPPLSLLSWGDFAEVTVV